MPYIKEGTLFKRADGRWEARLYINGVQKSIACCKNQRRAYEKLKYAVEHKRQLQKEDSVKSDFTLHGWLDYYYEKYKKGKIVSAGNIERTIRLHIKPNFPNKIINKVTLEDLENGIDKVKTSRNKEEVYKIIREALRKARARGKMKLDITEDWDAPQHTREEGTALDEKAVGELVRLSAGGEYEDVIKMYLLTGARAAELMDVEGQHIDFERGTIFLPGTKTELSPRYIPMFAEARAILKNYKLVDGEKVFKVKYEALKTYLRRLRESGKINVSVKDLRTTFGTKAAEKGIPEYIIGKWMGHSGTKTTRKYYIKVLEQHEIEQAKKFLLF